MGEKLWCASDVRTVEKRQKTSVKEGLTSEEARLRLKEYGPNVIETSK